jgi:hypothetical protein
MDADTVHDQLTSISANISSISANISSIPANISGLATSFAHRRWASYTVRGYSLSLTTGAVLSGVVMPGGNSIIRILRKWISAPSDSKQM